MFTATPNGPLWGAIFTILLLLACVTDVRARRIPNQLVLVIGAAGLAFSLAYRSPVDALLFSGGGLLLGFAIWIAFWLVGVLGAGDVKFFAAMGAWLGPGATWRAALASAFLGGVLAVFMLIRTRRLGGTLRRIALSWSSSSLAVMRPRPESAEGRQKHLPYGVAMAAGALAVAWIPQLIGWLSV